MKRGEQPHEVIIVRRSHKGHGDEHGGAWKVAFADFTLAMMALFMVLWIVQPQVDEDMQADRRFAHLTIMESGAGVFDANMRVPIELDGAPASRQPSPVQDTDDPPMDETAQAPLDRRSDDPEQLEALARLMAALALQNDAMANIQIHIVPQGLRVRIKDDAQRFMFASGSARMNAHFQALLKGLAGVLAGVENTLIISGHTDAVPYRQEGGYDNWNLSGERALVARQVLMASGLPAGRLLQVSAQADVMPLHPQDPTSGLNRRIEILLLTADAERLYRELFGEQVIQGVYPAS